MKSYGEWIDDVRGDGTSGNPKVLPCMSQHPAATEFVEEFYRFSATHPEFSLEEYRSILETHGVEWGFDEMRDTDVHTLDSRCVLAMIMAVIHVTLASTPSTGNRSGRQFVGWTRGLFI